MMRLRGSEVKSDLLLKHIASASLAVFLFYGMVFAANLSGITFYLGYRKYTVNIVLLTRTVDQSLLVASTAAFATALFALEMKNGVEVLRVVLALLYGLVLIALIYVLLSGFEALGTASLIALGLAFTAFSMFSRVRVLPLFMPVLYGMLVLSGVEAASLARWIYHLFSPSLVFADESWTIAFAETQISNILYPVLPVMLMFFSFSWIGEFTFKGWLAKSANEKPEPSKGYGTMGSKPSRASLVVSLVSVTAALFTGYYNYAAAGAHNPAYPGTDVPYYIECLKTMLNSGPAGALSYAARDDRFLYLVLQYLCFWFSGMAPEYFVTFSMPVILTFLLMLSAFLLIRVGRDSLHAVTAMLVTVFSFQVTVGLYAGLYANWFALVLVYAFYGLLMIALKGHRRPWLLLLTGLASTAVLYVHPWTWILLVMVILTAYVFVTLLLVSIRKKGLRSHIWDIKFLAVLLAVNIGMFCVKGYLGVGSGAGLVDGYVDIETFDPSILNIFKLRYFLDRTFNWYVGGFYASAPMILFAILGMLSFLDYADRYNRLLPTWMLISSSMVFVDFPWHARFLYLTPFNIYVTLGILFGAEQLSNLANNGGLKRMAPPAFWVFYVLAILFLLNYAVRCVMIKQFGSQGLTYAP